MCLNSKIKDGLIAEKDIRVYKVVDTLGRAPYHMEYEYVNGENNARGLEMVVGYPNDVTVHGGYLHAYTYKPHAELLQACFNTGVYRYDGDGRVKRDFQVVEMYVPKGTKYYPGDAEDICAKTLVWDKPQKNTVSDFLNGIKHVLSQRKKK